MRRFSLLLCLLVAAALGWIIGSAEAPTATEQTEAVLPEMHLALEAVNTGFKDISVATGIRSSDAACVTYELLPVVIEAHPRSTNAILSRSESTRRFDLIVNDAGRTNQKSPPCGRSCPTGLGEPICNVA
jgi:hypothetical protein